MAARCNEGREYPSFPRFLWPVLHSAQMLLASLVFYRIPVLFNNNPGATLSNPALRHRAGFEQTPFSIQRGSPHGFVVQLNRNSAKK